KKKPKEQRDITQLLELDLPQPLTDLLKETWVPYVVRPEYKPKPTPYQSINVNIPEAILQEKRLQLCTAPIGTFNDDDQFLDPKLQHILWPLNGPEQS
ncbi:unnamed protein product, partial [marine sediment metagenome]